MALILVVNRNQLDTSVQFSDRVARSSQREALHQSLREFQDWAVSGSSLGAPHRAMRQDPVPSLEIFGGSVILDHPKDIVEFKSAKRHRKWAPLISEPDEALGN
eukprot:9292535-Pyramimonas_sp.AAC.1